MVIDSDPHVSGLYQGLIGEITEIRNYILVTYPFGPGRHGTVVPYLNDTEDLIVVSNTKLGRLLFK